MTVGPGQVFSRAVRIFLLCDAELGSSMAALVR